MRVVVVSTDRMLFETGSAVAKRYAAYGNKWGSVDVVVLGSGSKHPIRHNISESVTVHAAYGKSLLGMFRAALIIMKLGKPDVTIAQEPSIAGLLALLTRAPLLLELHTDVTHAIYKKSFVGFLRTLLVPFVIKRARVIRAVSEPVRDAITRLAPKEKVVVLPIAVDISSLHKQQPPERPTILMVTRFTPEKDVATGLRVLEYLIPRIPDIQMIIVGTGPGVYEVAARTRQFGDHLVLRGFVPNPFNEIGAHVFLHTSCVEGYGMALIEAGAVGMPIVTTDVGIAREVYGGEVTLARAHDASALAESCFALLTNNNARNELGALVEKRARQHVAPFDEYVETYTALVHRAASL